METRSISIAKQFSRFPAGRYKSDGPFSGEAFRETWLLPALKHGMRLEVDLDGTAGYGSSFLEEAFGGLVRAGFSEKELLSRIQLKASDSSIADEIVGYIKDQAHNAVRQ